MKAILKSVSNEHYDLNTFSPENDMVFSLLLLLEIGTEGNEGVDNFDVYVCTPEWLCKHQWIPEVLRHTLVVRKYDLEEITQVIKDYIEKCEGDDWMEVAQKLSRYFAWEFEDYQPS